VLGQDRLKRCQGDGDDMGLDRQDDDVGALVQAPEQLPDHPARLAAVVARVHDADVGGAEAAHQVAVQGAGLDGLAVDHGLVGVDPADEADPPPARPHSMTPLNGFFSGRRSL